MQNQCKTIDRHTHIQTHYSQFYSKNLPHLYHRSVRTPCSSWSYSHTLLEHKKSTFFFPMWYLASAWNVSLLKRCLILIQITHILFISSSPTDWIGRAARKIYPKLINTSASPLFFTSARSITSINFLCYASSFGLLGCTATDYGPSDTKR